VEDLLFAKQTDEPQPLTVTELTAQAKAVIERAFSSVWVAGEVVNFTRAASGHWYFNINDGTSQLRCVCWKGTNFRIRFRPENGITVRIRGKLTIYPARGEFQLVVESLEPEGEGALRAAFEQIRKRLESEGLFAPEIKRPLPFLPRRVAVVTSRKGAAYYDIRSVLTRRTRTVSILLAPSAVQGEGAADSIRTAIENINAYNETLDAAERIDVMIVGRGGGSAEDLWAFNDEALARAIRASKIPVISAVGHEVDWTISDLVADARAATPSAAAEIVAGKEDDILTRIKASEDLLRHRTAIIVASAAAELQGVADRLDAVIDERAGEYTERFSNAASRISPELLSRRAAELSSRIRLLSQRHTAAQTRYLTKLSDTLGRRAATLDALSPLNVLGRGYSITQKENGRVVRSSADVGKGERINIRLGEGRIAAEVSSVE